MPLVRIDCPSTASQKECEAISNAVHTAMMKHFNVPQNDRFQIVQRRASGEMVHPAEFLGVVHTTDVVFVQIFCAPGRTLEAKKALYAEIANSIALATSIRSADVIINLVETARENWSFGNGVAQFAT